MNRIAIAALAGLLMISALILVAEQGCMARRDYGRSVGCWVARGIVETLAPQAR